MKIRDAMTSEVATVTGDSPLKEVARLLVERRISGVPVVDADGTLRGVVSEADFVAKEAGGADREGRHWLRWLLSGEPEHHRRTMLEARTAGEAMTSPAITADPERPLSEAARRMDEHRINRLPVVEEGRLVGIVTRADVVRAYARTDEDLRAMAAAALRAVDGVRVDAVTEGVVALSGTAPSKGVAVAVRQVIQHIDGVVAVDDRQLSWPPVEQDDIARRTAVDSLTAATIERRN
jgi:CBS domain-containing protein